MYPCRILKRGGGVTPFIKLENLYFVFSTHFSYYYYYYYYDDDDVTLL